MALTSAILALALTIAGGLAAAPAARAGTWVQVSCVNPDGSAAGSQGWTPIIAGGGYGSSTDTSCGPGSPAYGILSSDAAVAVNSTETLAYTPPSGSTLTGGRVDVAFFADGYGSGAAGTAVAYTPAFGYDASNVFFQCAASDTPCANGTNDFSGILEIPGGRGGSLYLSAGCGSGYNTGSCDEGGSEGAWSLVRLYWAQLLLTNSSAPTGTGFGGSLLAPGAHGRSELVLTAGDPEGPGVYEVAVEVDGHTLYDGTPDSNGGACKPVGRSGASEMFDTAQPCRRTETVDLPVETTALADGTHTLKVTVTDAAGNASVVYDGQLSTENAPLGTAPPSIGEATPQSGEALAGGPGTWTAPEHAGAITYSFSWQSCDATGAGCRTIPGARALDYTPAAADVGRTLRLLVSASDDDGTSTVSSGPSALVAAGPEALVAQTFGAPNGSGASEHAALAIQGPKALTRSYPERALTLAGTLSSGQDEPIAGATLELLEASASGGPATLIGRVLTAADGSFIAHVPPGPSRRVTIAYRAFSAAPQYAAQAGVTETVRGSVTLAVTPRRTAAHATILLRGRVAGPLPAHGVVVELLVHYHGAWEPFRDPRTTRSGRFAVRYRFEGAVGSFPFRAQVLGDQAGFPYAAALSRSVAVSTG